MTVHFTRELKVINAVFIRILTATNHQRRIWQQGHRHFVGGLSHF